MNTGYELDALIIGNVAVGVAGAALGQRFFTGTPFTQSLTSVNGALGASIGIYAASTMTNSLPINIAAGMLVPFLMGNRNFPELLVMPASYLAAQWLYDQVLNQFFQKGH